MSKPLRVIGSRVGLVVASAIVTTLVVSGSLSAFAQEVADGAEGIVGANSVNSASIIDGAVRSIDIRNGTVQSGDILNNTIATGDILDGTVSGTDIADTTVTGVDIGDATLGAVDLAADSVGSSEIAANTVGSSEIASGVVSSDELGTITRRSATSAAIATNTSGNVGVQCLAGEQVLSGGNDASTTGAGFAVIASRNDGANGWRVFVRNQTGANQTVTVHAYCLAP
jgi:hypothetical protein